MREDSGRVLRLRLVRDQTIRQDGFGKVSNKLPKTCCIDHRRRIVSGNPPGFTLMLLRPAFRPLHDGHRVDVHLRALPSPIPAKLDIVEFAKRTGDIRPITPASSKASRAAVSWGLRPAIRLPLGMIHRRVARDVIRRIWRPSSWSSR
jgi:hypothetical protein